VIQRIGDDRVGLLEQRLEHAAVGVETGGEQDRFVLAQMFGDGEFEFAMQGLRAADEADRGHAEAEAVERVMRRGDDFRMIGEAEVIVGAEIDHLAPAVRGADPDAPALRAFDQPLALGEAIGLDPRERRADMIEKHVSHGAS